MPLVLCITGILLLVLLIVIVKLDTFISFLIVSILLGLACGLNVSQLSHSLETGIGNTLGSLVIILGFGAMLGRLVAESGAAQRITTSLTNTFGIKHIQWGMALAGLIVGIPLFYTAGFVVVVPLIFAITASTGLPILYVGVPMLAALSVAHGFLPPHPSPTAIAEQLHASIGRTLIYGLIIAVPAIIISGVLFAKTLKKYRPTLSTDIIDVKEMPESELPSLGISLFTALLPLVLLTLTTIFNTWLNMEHSWFEKAINFVGNANMAMLISVLVAIYFLGLRRGQKMSLIMLELQESIKNISVILLIIAGSGVFMEVMKDGGVNIYIAGLLKNAAISPLILAWLIAAIIRVCIGSATVAGLTTVGIIAPVLQHTPLHPELMVLSIGAGSLMFSHVNDGGFWLFKEYFNLSIKQTFSTWTVMETSVSITGLLGVLLLSHFV